MVSPLVAFGLTIALCPLVLAGLRRWRVLDIPGSRSSHTRPVPRGGGIALVVGASVALAISTSVPSEARAGVVLAACVFGAIGLLEDLVGVPTVRRLVLQLVAAVLILPWLIPSFDGNRVWYATFAAGVVLWLVAYVNAFNFMDGINGISVAQVVVAGTTWYVIGRLEDLPILSVPALVVTGAAIAFAPFNFPAARMFLGDVGSYFLGAWLGAMTVFALRTGLAPEAVLGPLSLYLADTGTTLLRRARRGEALRPHREHAYQRLVQQGWSHGRTTLVVAAVMVQTSALGCLALTGSVMWRIAGDVLIVATLAAYVRAPTFLTRQGAESGVHPRK